MRFKCFTLPILAAALMLGGCSVDEDSLRRPMPEPTQMRGPGKVSPDYLIIKLKNEVSDPMSLASELPELKIRNVSRMYPGPAKYEARKRAMGLHLWYIVNFDRSVPVTRAAMDIAAADNIESIHYVRSLKPADAPETWPFNDPELPNQWHYMNYTDGANSKPGSDINLFPAWEITTGSPEVIVAVIDSGVDYRHEDLSGNMWVNEAELNGQPGVDDDGNGYTDDIYGYNFTTTFSGSTDKIDEVTNRDITPCDHGTHVAGTIAAMNNNGKGVSGIAGGDWAAGKPGVRIMSLQTMNDATFRTLEATGRTLKEFNYDSYANTLKIAGLASASYMFRTRDIIGYTFFYARNAIDDYMLREGNDVYEGRSLVGSNNVSHIYSLQNHQLNGKHFFGDKWGLNWSGSYSKTGSQEPDRRQVMYERNDDGSFGRGRI